jgi:hypothetical protein
MGGGKISGVGASFGGAIFANGVLTVFHLIKVGMPVNLNCGCFLNSFSGSFHLEQKRYDLGKRG